MSFHVDPMIPGLQAVLDLRLQQHALTASNLANANTPGYKAREIDFDRVLERAMRTPDALTRMEPKHVGGSGAVAATVTEIEAPPWAIDGNSVVPERENARLQSNALLYQAVTEGLDHKLTLLRFAASNGRA